MNSRFFILPEQIAAQGFAAKAAMGEKVGLFLEALCTYGPAGTLRSLALTMMEKGRLGEAKAICGHCQVPTEWKELYLSVPIPGHYPEVLHLYHWSCPGQGRNLGVGLLLNSDFCLYHLQKDQKIMAALDLLDCISPEQMIPLTIP